MAKKPRMITKDIPAELLLRDYKPFESTMKKYIPYDQQDADWVRRVRENKASAYLMDTVFEPGKLEDMAKLFAYLVKRAKAPGFSNVRVGMACRHEAFGCDREITFSGERPETDEERKARARAARERSARGKKLDEVQSRRQNEHERKEYERLKAKFEGGK